MCKNDDSQLEFRFPIAIKGRKRLLFARGLELRENTLSVAVRGIRNLMDVGSDTIITCSL